MTPKHDMRSAKGRAGLSQRLKERDHVVVVGRITKRDRDGIHARKASLADLKGAGNA